MKNITLTITLVVLLLVGLGSPSTAVAQQSVALAGGPVEIANIVLHDASGSYIVPVGKVLVVEHFIWALESDSTTQRLVIRPANNPVGVGDFALDFNATTPDMFTPERPIRILGDGIAGIFIIKNVNVDWRDVLIVGTLKDA